MTWSIAPLESVKDVGPYTFVGGPFGSNLTSRDYVDDGVPVIRGGNLPLDARFRDGDYVFVSSAKADTLRSNMAFPGDIVFTQRGTLGQVGMIPLDARYDRYVISQSQMKLTVDPSRACAAYVYYYFRQPDVVQALIGHAATSGVPHINLGVLRDFKVRLPAVVMQQRIASILSTHDDLIENNRRRMVLLEDAARLLFQEWFVRLRFPGREHTRIVDGVPRGWRRRDLGAVATFLSGGTPSKARADFWEGEIPWVSSGELTELRIDDASLHVTEEAVQAGSRLVPAGTILGVVRGMSLAREFRLAMTSRTVCFNQDLKAIVAGPEVEADYLFHALVAQRDAIRDRAGEASHGTKKLDTPVLAATPILVPPPALQRAFAEIVVPMNRLWDNLNRQNVKLRTARDLLLPRLMRGELTP